MEMNVPTVYLLGEDHLELIPEYLQLGSVVVVAPDRDILRRWTDDQQDDGAGASVDHPELNGLVVDLSARRVSFDGVTLNLTDLEFRVLAALMTRPGRAWSFTTSAGPAGAPVPISTPTTRPSARSCNVCARSCAPHGRRSPSRPSAASASAPRCALAEPLRPRGSHSPVFP